MENSPHQCINALTSFYALENSNIPDKIILVDENWDRNLEISSNNEIETGEQISIW